MTNPFKLPYNKDSLPVEPKHDLQQQINHFIRLPKTAGEAALMMEVARDTGVIAVRIDDPEVAANAHASHAYKEQQQGGSAISSEDLISRSRSYAETARQVVANGGALIQLCTYGTQDLIEFSRVFDSRRG